ncbi:hypothetical protein [Luteimonas sp. SDU101]|uniref:hypothetical protein n=1 Tax=Luteimonas sp. SDU101 TaxID=3422593 RepID=UPI003EBAB2E8
MKPIRVVENSLCLVVCVLISQSSESEPASTSAAAVTTPRPTATATATPAHRAAPATAAVGRYCIETDPRTGARIDRCAEHAARPTSTATEVREARRKADAAIEVLRDSTPEM